MNFLEVHAARGEIVTGLLYLNPAPEDLHDHANTVAAPLNSLTEEDLCPGSAALEAVNAGLR
jgi:2-oxoglutarate ferredoxin oxidoreductase subunit beta